MLLNNMQIRILSGIYVVNSCLQSFKLECFPNHISCHDTTLFLSQADYLKCVICVISGK
jgi:hypothetical protein